MMANSYSHASRLADNMDWSVSHRTPPPVPGQQQSNQYAYFPAPPNNHVASAITADEPIVAPEGGRMAFRADHRGFGGTRPDAARIHDHYSSPDPAGCSVRLDATQNFNNGNRAPNDPYNQTQNFPGGRKPSLSRDPSGERPSTSAGGGRRRGSFSFLRRNSSSQGHPSAQGNSSDSPAVYTSTTAPPPLPVTRIAQAHANAAADPNNRHFRTPSISSNTQSQRKISSEAGAPNKPNMLRKSSRMRQMQAEQERLAREAAQVPRQPPHLPSLVALPSIAPFGGEDIRHDSTVNYPDAYAYTGSAAQPPQPRATANFSRPSAMASSGYNNSSSPPHYAARPGNTASSSPDIRSGSGEYVSVDVPESIASRSRYSYSSSSVPINSVNSPRRVRRRKDPTPFNVLVIGAKNSGKTSLISFIRHSLALPSHKQSPNQPLSSSVHDNKSSFTSHYLETEIDGERVGLTLWDSTGLEKNIVDLQLREMTTFVESKFEETFVEEQKVMRSPGVRDTHIHCVFLILDPVHLDAGIASTSTGQNGASKTMSIDEDLDLQVIRALWGKTTVIPVISKADTLTIGHMNHLKKAVWQGLKAAKLDPLEALELEDDLDESDELDDDDEEDDIDEDEADEIFHDADLLNDHHALDIPKPPKKSSSHKRHSSLSMNGTITTASTSKLFDDDSAAPYIPMSILSPDPYDLPPFTPHPSKSSLGRKFPWGFADPLDPEHCDFARLRDSVFSEWRVELRDLARTRWYENWRTSRLEHLPPQGMRGGQQRVRGGVTPANVVPKMGRHFSPNSGGGGNTGIGAGAGAGHPAHHGHGHAQQYSAGGAGGGMTGSGTMRSPRPGAGLGVSSGGHQHPQQHQQQQQQQQHGFERGVAVEMG